MWVGPAGSQHDIVVLRGVSTPDRYGTPYLAFDDPTKLRYRGYLQPRSAGEATTDEQSSTVTGTVWLPYAADVTAVDRIDAGGCVWRVRAVKRLRWGSVQHTEVEVERIEGVAP